MPEIHPNLYCSFSRRRQEPTVHAALVIQAMFKRPFLDIFLESRQFSSSGPEPGRRAPRLRPAGAKPDVFSPSWAEALSAELHVVFFSRLRLVRSRCWNEPASSPGQDLLCVGPHLFVFVCVALVQQCLSLSLSLVCVCVLACVRASLEGSAESKSVRVMGCPPPKKIVKGEFKELFFLLVFFQQQHNKQKTKSRTTSKQNK